MLLLLSVPEYVDITKDDQSVIARDISHLYVSECMCVCSPCVCVYYIASVSVNKQLITYWSISTPESCRDGAVSIVYDLDYIDMSCVRPDDDFFSKYYIFLFVLFFAFQQFDWS